MLESPASGRRPPSWPEVVSTLGLAALILAFAGFVLWLTLSC